MSETATPHLVHVDQLAAEAARFGALLGEVDPGGWTDPVPTCPDWTVRKLARHLGTTHRWTQAMVKGQVTDYLHPRTLDLGLPVDNDDLPAWFEAGAEDLLETLRAVDGDTPMWAWGPDHHARFWSRRMLHETSIHRADLEIALGRIPRHDAEIAVDGIDEFLENLPHASVFAQRVRHLTGDGETLHLHATDEAADRSAEWLITLEPAGFRWRRAHAKGAVAVRGPVSDLYLFAWGRRKPGSGGVDVIGDDTLLDHWVQNAAF